MWYNVITVKDRRKLKREVNRRRELKSTLKLKKGGLTVSKKNRVELEHKVEELEKKIEQLESERAKKDGKLSKIFKTLLNIAAIAKLARFIIDLIEWLN